MTYRGKVKNGVVVFEGPTPAEGAEVAVEEVGTTTRQKTLSEKLLALSGTVKGMPSDMARNHDHYIHGTPKK